MDDTEVDRLRRAIRYSFGSSPHKKKIWLALLDMHVESVKAVEGGGATLSQQAPPTRRAAAPRIPSAASLAPVKASKRL